MTTPEVARVLRALDLQRTHWVDIAPGLRVQYRRPLECDMRTLHRGVDVDHCVQFVCGWEGFTEATFLGQGVGSDDAMPFDSDLWAAYVRDRVHLVGVVAQAIAGSVAQHLAQKAAAEKN